MGASVQFYGLSQVMEAANNLNCPSWAIFINSRLFSKYEMDDMDASMAMLRRNLEVLQQSNSNGIYTIKFFELQNGKSIKIKERTECDAGSFNFKLVEQENEMNGTEMYRPYGMASVITGLQQEIKLLKEEIERDKIEDEENTLSGALIGLIKRPDDFAVFVNTVRAAMGKPVQNLSMITGIRPGDNEQINEEEKLRRLESAMNTLEEKDPDLLLHLEKLSKMATDNPENFKMLLGMLGKK